MGDFITGLQFLTTIRLWPETEWSDERFGRSVRYFPLVGAVIGLLLAGMQWLSSTWLPVHVVAALIIIGSVFLTGGLHCDGFMDSMDGLLSGRSPERMLEIMKDSRVGANGVMAFACLIVLKWSIILDLPSAVLPGALFAAPITGRMAMVTAITSFPYARPHGIGKAFAEHAGSKAQFVALSCGLFLLLFLGWQGIAASAFSILVGLMFARFASKKVGGLTGDIYGAVTELTELSFLFAMLLLSTLIHYL